MATLTCGRNHFGPVKPGDRQVCQACGRELTAGERRNYWRTQRKVLDLKVAGLRATAKPHK